MAKDFMAKLLKLPGAVVESRNIHADVLRTPSPSLNFVFGKGWGLPRGFSTLLFGPPKGGKSLVSNAMIGQLHRDRPNTFAIKFDTEFREVGQLTPQQAQMWGIDPKRYLCYQSNEPDQIFDVIAKDIEALVQDGMDLGLVVIDSITGIKGRRSLNADTIMTQQIGDNAVTIQEGLKWIINSQRKCNFGLVLTAHIRAQMDQAAQMRGEKIRPAISFGTAHHCEYNLFVEPNLSKAGRTDLQEHELVNEDLVDFKGNAERTGHKVRVTMVDSSLGPKKRSGEFTLDYDRGIINTHEEVFILGTGRGIISKPTNLKYAFGDKEWVGKGAMLEALKQDNQLCEAILRELKEKDLAGMFPEEEKAEESV